MNPRIFSKIPPQVYALALLFKEHNFKLFLVGGSVRDCFLSVSNFKGDSAKKDSDFTGDFDFCTNALPCEMKHILSEYNLITIGEKYGTIGLDFNGAMCEITTFRSECDYSDNRHPSKVAFKQDITQDLKRRDFTINAMAYDVINGEIIDIFGGIADLEAKKIRSVGNANMRFSEDALRILRAFSLVARFDFNIERSTIEAIISHRHLLEKIARERIQSEITKILRGKYALKALKLMQKNDIFRINIPSNFCKIPQHCRIYASFLIFKSQNIFANKEAKIVERIFYALHLRRQIAKRAMLLADLGLKFNQNHIKIALSLHKKGSLLKKGFAIKDMKIDGFDLQKLGFKDKEIGVVKREILMQIYSKNIRNDRKILLKKAREQSK